MKTEQSNSKQPTILKHHSRL